MHTAIKQFMQVIVAGIGVIIFVSSLGALANHRAATDNPVVAAPACQAEQGHGFFDPCADIDTRNIDDLRTQPKLALTPDATTPALWAAALDTGLTPAADGALYVPVGTTLTYQGVTVEATAAGWVQV